MKIAVSILYTESWREMADIVLPNVLDYCKKHGYELRLMGVSEPFDGFRKIYATKDLIGVYGYDVVWNLDLDAIITNSDIKIESFLEDDKAMFICRDVNGYNGGSFIVQNSAGVFNFLDELISYKGQKDIHCEQDAIKRYVFLNGDAKIRTLHHPSINSYLYELYPEIPPKTHEEGQWQEGDFVLHLPGVGMEKRKEILKQYAK